MSKIKRIDPTTPLPFEQVRLTHTGNIIQVRHMDKKPMAHIRRLNRDLYVIKRTGEVKEFHHGETRAENIRNVRRTLARLRDLLNANVTDPKTAKWVTLTFAQPQSKPKGLYRDFRCFISRLQYRLAKEGLPHFEYIAAAEPGEHGFHIHLVMIFPETAPFIPNDLIAEVWGHGFASTKRIDDIDNLGLYLSAILTDLPDGTFIEGEAPKAVIKGGRLALYPKGFRIYRRSKGTVMPIAVDCTYADALDEIGNAELTFEKAIEVEDDAGEVVNRITYRQYQRQCRPHQKGGGD